MSKLRHSRTRREENLIKVQFQENVDFYLDKNRKEKKELKENK